MHFIALKSLYFILFQLIGQFRQKGSNCYRKFDVGGIYLLSYFCNIENIIEDTFAEVGQLIARYNLVSFLTPVMTSKSYAKHGIGL